MSDYKKHFKMYKSGKLWIVAGIVSLSLLGGGVKAYADTETNSQTATQNATTIPVSSAQIQQTAETSMVDSSSSSVKDEQASTMSESATVVAKQEQSLASQQTTTDAQNNNVVPNNNVQNTTVAKGTQSATTNASVSNTVTQTQTGTLPVNQVSGTTEVHQNGHWYLKDFQGNYLNGWQKLTDNRIVYYDPQNNQMQYGEHQINNQWYYFDTNCGAVMQGWYVLTDGRKVYYDVANDGTGRGMLHGIQTIDGQTYDFNIYTGAQTSGWETIDGQKYYFAPAMVHGMEKQIDGHWYCFDDAGKMQTGFIHLNDGREVYYNADGQMQYGEQKINNKWYHFQTDNGNMARGWYTLEDGRRVYYDVDADGSGTGMLHGLNQINNQSYYFDAADGDEKVGLQVVDNQTYYFNPIMVKNGEAKIGNHWYYFNAAGQMQTGFVTLKDGRLVYYNADGQMQYGEQKINDKWYHFQTDNGNTARGWYTLEDGRRVYYDVDTAGDGQGMLHGMQKIGDNYYYFNPYYGAEETGLKTVDDHEYYFAPTMVVNQEEYLNNHWYYFGANGQMQTGFVTLKDGRLVYYNADGQMQYGEQKINDKWYHFQTDNGNTARGWYTLEDGRQVYYDVDDTGNGQGMLHGLGKVGNDYYYFNDATGAKETGLKTLNGQTYNFAGNNGQALLNQFWTNDNQTYYFDQQGQMVKNQQLTIAGEQWQFDVNGIGTKVAVKIADNWNFDKKSSAELNNLGNIEGTTGEYNGLLIDASKPGAKFSPRDAGDTQVNANTVISVPVKANQYGAKITIELSGGTVDLTTNQGSQTGLKGTFTLAVPAMAADGTFAITFNSPAYLKNLKIDYLTQAPEEYPGTPSNVKAEDADWNLAAGSKQIATAQNSRAEYLGLKIDASTAGAKFAPRDNNDGTGLDTQINSGTIIYIPIASDPNGAKVTISGTANGQTLTLDGQAVVLGQAINVDSTSAHYLKLLVSGTGSAYLTNIALHYNAAYPGTPTVSAKDTDWNLSNDTSRPTVQNDQGEYNGLKIDGTNGKFAPRATDTQVNNGTIIYIPIASDPNGAKVTISGTANGQTLTLDGQAVVLGQAINVDSTSAHYLKLLVSGTGSAYLTDIAVDYGSDQTNDFPGTLPTGKSEDISWDLAQAGDRPSAEKSTTSYNGLQIDARNGKFSPRATGDTQVNNGTIIYIPLYQDAKGAILKVSGNANGQTLTLDGQSITLGTPIMLDATTAHYLKLTVTGTGSAYLTGIDLDYLSDDSYQTHVVKVGANEQYQTIQSALDANQSSLKDRLVLEIDPGTYTEAVQVNKPGVIFKNADSTGQKAVVITYNNYSSNTFDANGNFVPQDNHDLGTSKCGTVIVTAAATGFSAENITFENSYNVTDHTKEGEQTPAVAFDSLADQVYLKNCNLIGRQDTVYLQGKGNRVYINGGKIEGTVDFVFGDANALIENATINMAYYNGRKTGYFTAPNTAKGQTGLVFNNCQLTVDGQYGSNAAIYLARPWQTTIQTTSKVVNGKMIITAYDPNTKDSKYTDTSSAVTFINCQLPTNLAQNVFGVWTGKYEDASGKQSTVDITYHPDVRFVEFNNSTTTDKKNLTDEKGNVLGTVQTGDANAYLKQVMSEMKIGTTAGAWQPVDKL